MVAFDGGAVGSEAAGNRGVGYADFTDSTVYFPRTGEYAPIAILYGASSGLRPGGSPRSRLRGFW